MKTSKSKSMTKSEQIRTCFRQLGPNITFAQARAWLDTTYGAKDRPSAKLFYGVKASYGKNVARALPAPAVDTPAASLTPAANGVAPNTNGHAGPDMNDTIEAVEAGWYLLKRFGVEQAKRLLDVLAS